MNQASQHMISYQRRLQDHKSQNIHPSTTIISGFKRHHQVSPATTTTSIESTQQYKHQRKYDHRNNRTFLPGHK